MRQRTVGDGVVPVAARTRALEQARRSGMLDASTGMWVLAGPTNVPGRVSALAVDPNDPDTIWLGSAEGGVFRQGGIGGSSIWNPVFDDQPALSVGSIATHPTDSDVVYVGTGEETGGGYSYDGEGVFVTTDHGQSWINLGLAEVRRIGKLAMDPLNPDRIFVAAVGGLHNIDEHRGVYRSVDGGDTWDKILFVQDDAGAVDVAIDPQDPARIFAATWQRSRANGESYYGGEASGIYRSTNGGDTWVRLHGGLPSGAGVGRIGLAIAPSNPQIVYAVIVSSQGTLDGVYRSDDGGDVWARVNQPGFPSVLSSYGYYFGQIRVDPANPDLVYVLDVQLWRSSDGGVNYGAIGQTMHVDQHALVVGPGGRLLVGNDGGFYRRENDASPFEHAARLAISQFYDLCVHPVDSTVRFGGTQDNGTLRTFGGLNEWQNVLGGDGMECSINAFNGDEMLAEAQWGFIFRSTDGGDSFVPATSGLASGDRFNWVTPITHDPLNGSRVYTGSQRVYRSVNGGQSWFPVSPDLTTFAGEEPADSHDPAPGQDHGQDPIWGTITAIAVSPLSNDRIWAGTDDGNVWVSVNDAASWTRVNPPGPAYWVTEIAPDPFDAEAAWMTVSGYRLDDTLPYLRYTSDLGGTWQDLSAGLPQVPLSSVVLDPDWRGRVYVASDLGVHVSDDGGLTWNMLGSGMPYVVVLDLVLHEASRTLFAGTHGRSMFEFDLDQLPPADGDGDGADNNNDCALADPGVFAAPGEVPFLEIDRGPGGEALLGWTDVTPDTGPDTAYDVAVGAIDTLAASGTTGAVELVCDVSTPAATDPAPLASGEGRYYLVRATNACGVGDWGSDSEGTDRALPPGTCTN